MSEDELRAKLLGFIRMVSRKQLTTLRQGEAVFRAGDPADQFYIVSRGTLVVANESELPAILARQNYIVELSQKEAGKPREPERAKAGGAQPPVLLKRLIIREGESFGEIGLLDGTTARRRTVLCASKECEVVSILGSDFLFLVKKSEVVRRSFEELKARRTSEARMRQRERQLEEEGHAAASASRAAK